jgi:hypothetical protein
VRSTVADENPEQIDVARAAADGFPKCSSLERSSSRPERNEDMNILAVSKHHTGLRLAEVAFLLIVFAGVWLAAADIWRLSRARGIVAGVALALAGLLLIVATRRFHFG